MAKYDLPIAAEEGDANDARTVRKGGHKPLVCAKGVVHVAVTTLNAFGGSAGRHGHHLKGDLTFSCLIHLDICSLLLVQVGRRIGAGKSRGGGDGKEESGEEGKGSVHGKGVLGKRVLLLSVDRANMRAELSDRIERYPWSKVTFVNWGE